MDPNACLQRLLDAYHAWDFEGTHAAAEDLSEWLLSGGAMPNLSRNQLFELVGIASNWGCVQIDDPTFDHLGDR